MIEIINAYDNKSTEELKEVLELPKNVRQIGELLNHKKIYIEDYVYTYLHHYAAQDLDNPVVAVLLGRYEKQGEDRILFVSGAVKAKYYLNDSSGLVMTHETWGYIYEEIKQYFTGYEIIGWFVSRPGFAGEINDQIYKIHTSNFAGQDKLLFVIDPIEKDDCFYLFEGNQLRKQSGYYVYYERNEIMQNYMLENRVQEEKVIEEQEEVIQNFRKVVTAKKQEADQKKIVKLLYATSTALAIIVLVIGIALLDNYDKMRSLESVIYTISNSLNSPQKVQEEHKETVVVPNNNVQDQELSPSQGTIAVEVKEGNIPDKMDVNPIQPPENIPPVEVKDEPDPPKDDVVTPVEEKPVEEEPREEDSKPVVTDPPPAVVEPKYYTVKYGDSLDSISYKLYKDRSLVKEIQALNNIENPDKIFEGQKIQLP